MRVMGTKNSKGKRTLLRSTAAMYLLQIAKYLFPFITLPYLARVLGTDGFAVRSYVLSVMTFVSMVAEFGFMNYAIAQIIGGGLERENVSKVSSGIMYARLVLFVPLLFAVAAMDATVLIMHENQAYVWIAFAGVFFGSLLPDFVFRAYEKMGIITVRYVVSKGVSVALTFLLIHAPEDLILVPVLDLVTSFIAFVWSWWAAVGRFGVKLVKVPWNRIWRDLSRSSVYFVSGLSTIVFSSLTTFLIGIFNTSATDIAYWGIATIVINGLASLYSPLSQSLYPHYMKRAKDGEDFSLRRLYLLCLGPLALGMVLLAVLAEPVMWVLGGSDYIEGSYVIAILSPLVMASFYVQLSGWPSLGAVGKVNELTKTTVVSMVFHVAELVLLAVFTNYELCFVAIARTLSEIVLAVLRVVECRKAGVI